MRIFLYLCISIAMLFSNNALAQFASSSSGLIPISDVGTRVLGGMVDMKWDEPIPSRTGATSNLMRGSYQVKLQLNTKIIEARNVRIYIVLEPPKFGDLRANYKPLNLLLEGHATNSQRGLIYAGVAPANFSELVSFEIVTDGSNSHPEQINFYFEAELL